MRMKKGNIIVLTVAVLMGLFSASCSRLIYDGADAGNICEIAVRFKYEYNMKYADAFANEVNSVTLYVFDPQTGAFVTKVSDAGAHLDEHYTMTLPQLKEGTYDLIAWCGLVDSKFVVNDPASKEELLCQITAKTKSDKYVNEHLGSLYYGYVEKAKLEKLAPGSEKIVVIPLIKNTNSVRVMLQTLNVGTTLLPEDYEFYVEDINGLVNWRDEIPSGPMSLEYYAWDKKSGTVEYSDGTTLTAVVAEFTLNRLFNRITDKTRLKVVDKVIDKTVIDVPIVDYFLLVKGNYNRIMSDQEYLDRQDDYQIAFFMDNRHGWDISAGIFVNSWHVVLQNSNL